METENMLVVAVCFKIDLENDEVCACSFVQDVPGIDWLPV